MNYIFKRNTEGEKTTLTYEEGNDISLGGYKNGLIAKMLKKIINEKDVQPFAWTLDIAKEYHDKNEAVLIDIKPNGGEFFYCELDKVFGVCFDGWTPIMYRLIRLFPYIEDRAAMDENLITYEGKGHEIIYTMLYLYGSFEKGEIVGTWNYPARSSANALLLWPEALSFFYQKINQYDPEFSRTKISEITFG